jgi:hypothetical protein
MIEVSQCMHTFICSKRWSVMLERNAIEMQFTEFGGAKEVKTLFLQNNLCFEYQEVLYGGFFEDVHSKK